MTEIINSSFFDPIAGYIRSVEPDKNYLVIEVPEGLTVSKDEVVKYFESDATLVYERGKSTKLKGTIKDSNLFGYLMAKYYENGPKFNTQ